MAIDTTTENREDFLNEEILRTEVDDKLHDLFKKLPSGSDEGVKALTAKVHRKDFSDKDVDTAILDTLFGSENSAEFDITLADFKDLGIVLSIENLASFGKGRSARVGGSGIKNGALITIKPLDGSIQPAYNPSSLENQRTNCFGIISTVETVVQNSRVI